MARDALHTDLERLVATLDEAQRELEVGISDGLRVGERLRESCRAIADASSGSWVGWHSRMYYRAYEEPPVSDSWNTEWGGVHGIPDGWEERTLRDVQNAVEQRAGTELADVAAVANRIRERCEPLRRDALTILSPLVDLAGLEKEGQLLQKIEDIKWIVSPSDFVRAMAPSQVWSRDSGALSQGIQAPLHVNVEAAIVSSTSTIATCRDFLNDALRLARQCQTKLAARERAPLAVPLSHPDGELALRTRLRHLSIALFLALSLLAIAGLASTLRFVELSTILEAVVVVGGAALIAGLYALLVDRKHAARAVGIALAAGGAIATVDQLLLALK